MTLARAKELLGLPAIIIGTAVAIWGAVGWLQRLVGTDARLTGHVVAESTYHRQSDSALREMHGHLVESEKWQEAQLRGECIRSNKNDLAQQGLLLKCRQLGIER